MNSYGPSGSLCKRCNASRLKAEQDPVQHISRQKQDADIAAIMVTTETCLNGLVAERLGVVGAECAYGMNIFKDLFAGVRNIVGGRSSAIQDTMREARATVVEELRREAHSLGADAVVGLDLDYTQIGDSGWNMVLVVATGTAVTLKTGARLEK
ncbi:YbjQ family protein [Jannaschia ovalis]|uniref:UPF0145 protein P8627_11055 n=1 Tax=Jannaschia ovalis TaxID=3038773 RepID=A0ABY8L880_9RHOB|nr:YbjQ family protein [Jannaschia sp. GRR-S6-38]WGH77574.1 YbjQ family protein [Jannaschia sp. GRR-S6-38]